MEVLSPVNEIPAQTRARAEAAEITEILDELADLVKKDPKKEWFVRRKFESKEKAGKFAARLRHNHKFDGMLITQQHDIVYVGRKNE